MTKIKRFLRGHSAIVWSGAGSGSGLGLVWIYRNSVRFLFVLYHIEQTWQEQRGRFRPLVRVWSILRFNLVVGLVVRLVVGLVVGLVVNVQFSDKLKEVQAGGLKFHILG